MSTPSIEDVLAAHWWPDDQGFCECGDGSTAGVSHVADAIRAHLAEHTDEAAGAEHECITKPLCDGWPFGVDDAYRTIAAVSWPAERIENRDSWAVTMRDRPDLFEQEVARAQERLNAAIAHGRAALTGGASGAAEEADQ